MLPHVAKIALLALTLGACAAAPPPVEARPPSAPTPQDRAAAAPLFAAPAVAGLDKLAACTASGKTALRVTLGYDGKALRLVSCAAFDQLVPPTRTPPITHDQTGTWFEVHDGQGALLYQQGLFPALLPPPAHEAPGASGEMHWVKDPEGTERTVEILLPAQATATSLELFDAPVSGAPAVLVTRIPLRFTHPS